MEQDRRDITNDVFTNYEAIVNRAHAERSRAISATFAGVAPFVWDCGDKAVAWLRSALRGKRLDA